MTKIEILKLIEQTRSKEYYLELSKSLIKDKGGVNNLIGLILNHKHPIDFRASYLLDIIHTRKPEILDGTFKLLIDILLKTGSDSVKRHILKILSTSNTFVPEEKVLLFDFCVKIVESPKEKVASKAHAMQLMGNICQLIPELKEETREIIENQLERNSVGFKAKAKFVINQLKKIK